MQRITVKNISAFPWSFQLGLAFSSAKTPNQIRSVEGMAALLPSLRELGEIIAGVTQR
jgi:hypothetical protein